MTIPTAIPGTPYCCMTGRMAWATTSSNLTLSPSKAWAWLGASTKMHNTAIAVR
jgi:hypothetical protein